MGSKQEIDEMYLGLVGTLEADYFRIVFERNETGGIIGQHRELRMGRSLEQFNELHGEIWGDHTAELIASGHLEPPVEIPLDRDLAAEIDELRSRIERLEGSSV